MPLKQPVTQILLLQRIQQNGVETQEFLNSSCVPGAVSYWKGWVLIIKLYTVRMHRTAWLSYLTDPVWCWFTKKLGKKLFSPKYIPRDAYS